MPASPCNAPLAAALSFSCSNPLSQHHTKRCLRPEAPSAGTASWGAPSAGAMTRPLPSAAIPTKRYARGVSLPTPGAKASWSFRGQPEKPLPSCSIALGKSPYPHTSAAAPRPTTTNGIKPFTLAMKGPWLRPLRASTSPPRSCARWRTRGTPSYTPPSTSAPAHSFPSKGTASARTPCTASASSLRAGCSRASLLPARRLWPSAPPPCVPSKASTGSARSS